jgi:branched-chain amino acid transport system permease protein
MTKLLQTLADGITIGSLYALIALGYTMVYGVLGFINFAHGTVVMLGAWLSFVIASKLIIAQPELSPWVIGPVTLILAMAGCGLLGWTIERLAYRPLRSSPRLNVLITAIGVSLLLENTGQLKFLFGSEPQPRPDLLPSEPWFTVAEVHVYPIDIFALGTAVALMVALELLVHRTKLGLAMRAVSFDHRNASLMGVPIDRVVAMTFVVGSMLAAAAGFLLTLKYPALQQPAHTAWIMLGMKAFVAAVVGGIGNVRGAMLGGLLIGLIENFGAGYLSPQLRDVYVFVILIFVLLVRPSGILGKPAMEKV